MIVREHIASVVTNHG